MRTVLLLGDSLVQYGDWQELLPGYQCFNQGVEGETVGGLAARLGWEVERVSEPDHIVIMSGTNNILMEDRSFPVIFETMLPRLILLEPEADISVVGIAPMRLPWVKEDLLLEVNKELQEKVVDAGGRFLDVTPDFEMHCRPVGNPCFLMDGVHFSPHGYRVLGGAVRGHLESI